jgi:hypothetical protein
VRDAHELFHPLVCWAAGQRLVDLPRLALSDAQLFDVETWRSRRLDDDPLTRLEAARRGRDLSGDLMRDHHRTVLVSVDQVPVTNAHTCDIHRTTKIDHVDEGM